jgi:hypothetical protein
MPIAARCQGLTMTQHIKRGLLGLLVLLIFGSMSAAGEENERHHESIRPPFTIQLTGPPGAVKVGNNIVIEAVAINASKETIILEVSNLSYEVICVDRRDHVLPKTDAEISRESTGVVSTVPDRLLKQGDREKEEIDINEKCKISEPGKYFIYVTRYALITDPNDDRGSRRVTARSNLIEVTVIP